MTFGLQAQSAKHDGDICGTHAKAVHNSSGKSSSVNIHQGTCNFSSNETYCFKLNVTIVDNGGPNISLSQIGQRVQILNDRFSTIGISFDWDWTAETVYNKTMSNVFGSNYDQYAIDVYIFNVDLPESKANGVGEESELYLSYNHFIADPDDEGANENIFAHEMGHVMGLFHTWFGYHPDADDAPNCLEVFPGSSSNSCYCGDYVADTPADNYATVNGTNDCNDTYVDDEVEPAVYWENDVKNIMTYYWNCMGYFTQGQGNRIKYFLEVEPLDHLIDAMCPPPPICETVCNPAPMVGDILDSILPTNSGNCREYKVTKPAFTACSGDVVYIDWGTGDGPVVLGQGTTYYEFPANGTYTVTLSVEFQGEICFSRYTVKEVNDSCGQPPVCDDCVTVVNDILASVENTGNCQDFIIHVDQAFLDCYDIRYNLTHQSVQFPITSTQTPLNVVGAFNSLAIFVYEQDGTTLCHNSKIALSTLCFGGINNSKGFVSPNPYTPGEILKISNMEDKNIQQIEILNITGNVIRSIQTKQSSLRLNTIKEGLYWLKVTTDKGVENIRFIVNETQSK